MKTDQAHTSPFQVVMHSSSKLFASFEVDVNLVEYLWVCVYMCLFVCCVFVCVCVCVCVCVYVCVLKRLIHACGDNVWREEGERLGMCTRWK